VRIISGEFKGRVLKAPRDRTVRPSSDRIREAWFGILGARLDGAAVADLFAGSGALGLEALSRGARSVDFVERARRSLAALEDNVEHLDVAGRVSVHRTDAMRYAARLEPAAFDVVFADPPYRGDDAERLVSIFRERPFARILSIEHSARSELAGDERRQYGSTAITFCYAP
jgi:16S rRNA (guanine966-N2)-methyltransferase